MSYASPANLEAVYGPEALEALAGDGEAGQERLQAALTGADAEINTYLASRYQLPLPKTPDILTQLAVDIALYRLCMEGAMLSDDRRTRYEDALRTLRDISAGRARLPFLGEASGESSVQPASAEAADRQFTRSGLGGLT